MPWDTIRKAAFQPWGDLAPILPIIRERSRQRRRSNPEFAKVRERVAEYLKNEKNRKVITVSQMIASNKKGTKIPKRPSQRRNAPGLKRHALGYHP